MPVAAPSVDLKKEEILHYLHTHVFDPILNSPNASNRLKQGVRMTIVRCEQRDARGIRTYYWSAVVGTDRSTKFAKMMREEGFNRFEEVVEEFRNTFDGVWLPWA
jgi:hypothetical protein